MYENIISQTEFQRNHKKLNKLLLKGEVIVVKNNKPEFVVFKLDSYNHVKDVIKDYQNESLGNIIRKLRINKEDFKANGIDSISIFGSYARGEESKDSDLDLVYTSKKKGLELIGLSEVFDNSFKNLKVNSLPLSGIKKELLNNIEGDLINVF